MCTNIHLQNEFYTICTLLAIWCTVFHTTSHRNSMQSLNQLKFHITTHQNNASQNMVARDVVTL